VLRVAVLASGSGSNLQALMNTLRGEAPARVALVLSNRPGAGALGRAAAAGVPGLVLEDPADGRELIGRLAQHEIGLVVLAGYLKLVPPPAVAAYAGRMINIHPALLPSFGGAGMYGLRVHEAVLASGATVTGATVHLVSSEYDRGRIVAQWPVPVLAGDTAARLAERVLAVEHQLLPAVVLAAARAGRVVRLCLAETALGSASGIAGALEVAEGDGRREADAGNGKR
jgi:formyltetrahydrofolate-dependent phosphoribosylglycinamide formyltransferase